MRLANDHKRDETLRADTYERLLPEEEKKLTIGEQIERIPLAVYFVAVVLMLVTFIGMTVVAVGAVSQ